MQPQPSNSSSLANQDAPLTPTQYYNWKQYRCAYELHTPHHPDVEGNLPLLLIHPIGVGLSRRFWDRFCREWLQTGQGNPIYNPDLLGCGESDLPHLAYNPQDWAEQLQHFIQTVIQKPVLLVVQGALLPVAVELVHWQANQPNNTNNWVQGLVLAGPPAWALITQGTPVWRHRSTWNFFDSPLGSIFYRYARRREFLRSFSVRQLFANEDGVDDEWLNNLEKGAANLESRHAVFS
ncbi:MAG TPA: alpha/beta fold hydrolase, partial [Candidatus Caenarcaniphilales bacterium]